MILPVPYKPSVEHLTQLLIKKLVYSVCDTILFLLSTVARVMHVRDIHNKAKLKKRTILIMKKRVPVFSLHWPQSHWHSPRHLWQHHSCIHSCGQVRWPCPPSSLTLSSKSRFSIFPMSSKIFLHTVAVVIGNVRRVVKSNAIFGNQFGLHSSRVSRNVSGRSCSRSPTFFFAAYTLSICLWSSRILLL